MSNKHTPGPWKVHPIAATAVVGSSGFVVAACGGHSTNTRDPEDLHDELTANARLIATAPELLEACEEALGALNGAEYTLPRYVVTALERAIAKATGESS